MATLESTRPFTIITLLGVALLASCSEPSKPVASVEVTPARAEVEIGATVQLTATPKDEDGNALTDRAVSWSSGDTSVATVDQGGVVTGIATVDQGGVVTGVELGAVVINATSENKIGSSAVTVSPGAAGAVDTVILSEDRVTLIVQETFWLGAVLLDTLGKTLSGIELTWSSSDPAKVRVISPGLVHALDVGTATITASVVNGTASSAAVASVAPTFASISAGERHTCGVTTDGEGFCWGNGAFGKLGNNSLSPDSVPSRVLVSAGFQFASILAGGDHTCGLSIANEAFCWGRNDVGQLGIGTADADNHPTRNAVTGGLTFGSITVGRKHTCAVTPTDVVYCWGDNTHRQLGDSSGGLSTVPLPVQPSFSDVTAGGNHTCAVDAVGAAYCWGADFYGQLGNDSVPIGWTSQSSGTTKGLSSIWASTSTDVFAVGDSGTILHYNGTSWSPQSSGISTYLEDVWGTSATNVFAVGEFGTILHYNGASWTPQPSGISGDTTLLATSGTSSADVFSVGKYGKILHYDGAGWSPQTSGTQTRLQGVWASSATNVLAVGGLGTILHYNGTSWSHQTSGTYFLHAVWGSSATDVFAVGLYGWLLHYNGVTWNYQPTGTSAHLRGVWGSSSNDVFAVGGGGAIVHYDGSRWNAQPSGTSKTLGSVWGTSPTDVFAVGHSGTILHYEQAGLVAVSSGLAFTSLTAGTYSTCGVTTGGAGYCWGLNTSGQLGDGTQTSSRAPVAVRGGLTFQALSEGANHSCGLTTGRQVYCWGHNHFGQLGDGSTARSSTPVRVQIDKTIASVNASTDFTCAISARGVAYCWGLNSLGQLGIGSTADFGETTPVRVSGPR